ncbi:hypothetical protein D9M71_813120 [compost metagenome]
MLLVTSSGTIWRGNSAMWPMMDGSVAMMRSTFCVSSSLIQARRSEAIVASSRRCSRYRRVRTNCAISALDGFSRISFLAISRIPSPICRPLTLFDASNV